MTNQNQKKPLQAKLTKICASIMISSLMMISACGDNSDNNQSHNSQNPKPNNGSNSDSDNSSQTGNSNIQNPIQANIDNLKNTKWILIKAKPDSLNTVPNLILSETEEVTLQFNRVNNEDSFSFNVGCNINSGDYSLEKEIFKAGMVMGTEMYCKGISQYEQNLQEFFRQDVNLNIKTVGSDTILTLADQDGEEYQWKKETAAKINADINLLNKAKTYRWYLIESNHPTLKSLPDLSSYRTELSFENSNENKITYSLCNIYMGKFSYGKNNKVTVFDIIDTKKACPSNIQNDEITLDNMIKQGSTITFDTSSAKPKLIQTFEDDTKIIWEGDKKVFTATVKGKELDTVTGDMSTQSKYYNNVTIPDDGFCASDNIYQYEFLTIMMSNIKNGKCTEKGDLTYLSEIQIPGSNKKYTHEIQLVEDFS